MANRPCLGCGKLSTKTRCPACSRIHERNRTPRPTNLTRDWTERQRRARAVADHRAIHGDWCPGWQRSPHQSTDLTADHVAAVATGGNPKGELEVLCRSCNGAKGAHQGQGGTPPTG